MQVCYCVCTHSSFIFYLDRISFEVLERNFQSAALGGEVLSPDPSTGAALLSVCSAEPGPGWTRACVSALRCHLQLGAAFCGFACAQGLLQAVRLGIIPGRALRASVLPGITTCFSLFCFVPRPVVPRAHSWLCAQDHPWPGLGEPYAVPGIEPRAAM